jgi:hypothetical protein
LVNLLTGLGDLRAAAGVLDDPAAGEPPGEAYVARAVLALRGHHWEDAAKYATAGLQLADLDPTTIQHLRANRGLALVELGQAAQGLKDLDGLERPISDDCAVRYARGVARLQTGDVTGADSDPQAAAADLREFRTSAGRSNDDGAGDQKTGRRGCCWWGSAWRLPR